MRNDVRVTFIEPNKVKVASQLPLCEELHNLLCVKPYGIASPWDEWINAEKTEKAKVSIRNITVNKPKRLVTVVFTDGKHEIIKCAKGDHFDVNIGVALAIAQHFYGSKNKFHKDIVKKAKVIETKGKQK